MFIVYLFWSIFIYFFRLPDSVFLPRHFSWPVTHTLHYYLSPLLTHVRPQLRRCVVHLRPFLPSTLRPHWVHSTSFRPVARRRRQREPQTSLSRSEIGLCSQDASKSLSLKKPFCAPLWTFTSLSPHQVTRNFFFSCSFFSSFFKVRRVISRALLLLWSCGSFVVNGEGLMSLGHWVPGGLWGGTSSSFQECPALRFAVNFFLSWRRRGEGSARVQRRNKEMGMWHCVL